MAQLQVAMYAIAKSRSQIKPKTNKDIFIARSWHVETIVELFVRQVKERNANAGRDLNKWVNEKVEKCKKQLKDTYQYLQLDDLK